MTKFALTIYIVCLCSEYLGISSAELAGHFSDSDDCYVCNGFDYRGQANTTVSGKICQRWDTNVPHKIKRKTAEWDLSENYCRAVNSDVRPWCYTTDPEKRREYCDLEQCTNSDGSLHLPDYEYSTECSFRRGMTYRGNVSTTMSGRNCATWGSRQPHRQIMTPENYPCSGLEENFCRNPHNYFYRDAPWCYTTDRNKQWEYCWIPLCGPDGQPIITQQQTPAECGISLVDPVFTKQDYAIEDGRIVKGIPAITARIVGGNIVKPGTWPWMIQVKWTRRNRHQCGGTLIHESWVLTAAHCLGSNNPKAYLVRAAQHHIHLGEHSQTRSIRNYWIHEDNIKGRGLKIDVALILVNEPFEITDTVRPACLPEPEFIVPSGTYCVAIGWGATHDPNWSKELKQVVLRVDDRQRLRQRIFSFTAQSEEGPENICKGDSGGPFVCLENGKWVVQGVNSFTYGCKGKNTRGGFAQVSKYVSWINQKIEMHTPQNIVNQ